MATKLLALCRSGEISSLSADIWALDGRVRRTDAMTAEISALTISRHLGIIGRIVTSGKVSACGRRADRADPSAGVGAVGDSAMDLSASPRPMSPSPSSLAASLSARLVIIAVAERISWTEHTAPGPIAGRQPHPLVIAIARAGPRELSGVGVTAPGPCPLSLTDLPSQFLFLFSVIR